MKRLILLALIIPCFSVLLVNAQSVQVYKVSLDEKKIANTHFTKTKYYLKSFKNTCSQQNKTLEETVEEYLKKSHWSVDEKKPWINQPWILPLENESDADIILSGTYNYTCKAIEGESVYKEKIGTQRLPYFVTSIENKVDLDIVFTFDYKDGSPSQTDTLSWHKKSLRAPGKKFTPLDELEQDVTKYAVSKIKFYTNLKSSDKVVLNFPKVKFKDKALKTKYASIKTLYKERKYLDAANLINSLYQQQPSPDLAHALAISYELIGNFPKAAEYYKIKTDFHANVRMKQNNKLLDYAKSLGYEPTFIDL
ncbi:MAG: hypothetical protein N4A71_14720 [Carboxylicivirga sp.]|jgi:CRISPR/Cas system-associated protein Cas5 (RAMP superfamily)|nr:hypothetical protein [Carboxylicivirga sp.]